MRALLTFLLVLPFLFSFLFPGPVSAQRYPVLTLQSPQVCPATLEETTPPLGDTSGCQSVGHGQIDPQDTLVWICGTIELTAATIEDPRPLGFYVSGKGTRAVYVNGQPIGSDGAPGATANDEQPAQMDSVFYLPRDVVLVGANDIAVKMSARRGLLHLAYPVHLIAIGPFQEPSDMMLRAYWPSLLTFGVFAVGFIYFGMMAAYRRDLAGSLLLTLMSVFAAGQLVTEMARSLFPYLYPYHDLRLILIVVFSLGFGLCLLGQLFLRFPLSNRRWVAGITIGLTLLKVAFTPGFDGKAAMAVFMPAIAGTVLCAYWAAKRQPLALRYLAAMIIFSLTIMIFAEQFLNTLFFFSVAALLIFLFAQQARFLIESEEQRREEASRAHRLEQALENATRRDEGLSLTVRSAGRLERIAVSQLAVCSGAGDYAELCLMDGRKLLHQGRLAELETALPATFLRVHRSHIVNAEAVESLSRDPSGTGSLTLTNGMCVPVSRRIMPQVKRALA
ncbi:LytTR family transcriptional regulator DNA-binding domain-containing protein [Parvularcula sp. LCG005]|uniref:LytTR family transcriptional regulator DNA-binding domain-containing protein n=1 Tax=Parvularcula sp. LCG005 TaxID=3078805 RepID=UPI002942425B|nr:LytTR family transcriptional regulator DNA-binding domain-containing protein [Parvularcula sp. LCG005]WOI54455.1 LytTR family transcriptional regulator DNA-binding domain-containing protein [Parvularcula sp. LCG005]